MLYNRRFLRPSFLLLLAFFITVLSCKQDRTRNDEPQFEKGIFAFEQLGADKTGIEFINKIFESDQLNYYTYEYLYNGAGVSVADFNNDGFQDLFFTCNMGKNKIFANRGNFNFEDLSKTSGINSVRDWCTGTTITDINNDGLIDIYISRSGWFEDSEIRKNLLYVNQGNFQFTEEAEQYGISDAGHSTQSSFFDMDQDGDLDLYVMNHPTLFTQSVQDFQGHVENPDIYQSDQLYENVNGKYIRITKEAGIENYGHGLGLSIVDFNGDLLPDIYVSNDYQQHDFLYINQGNKSFKEESSSRLKHQAKFSMGTDVVDLSKNGSFDIMAVEMMPADNFRQKTNMADMNPELYNHLLKIGLQHQEMHNVLQMNSGDGHFTDIAYQYKIAQTDWSWSPLFGDYDADGHTDVFVSNGYRRDVLNKDLDKKVEAKINKSSFKFTEVQDLIPSHKSKNYFFKNTGESFEQQDLSFNAINTNGAATADLDNDGNLDIICNNMEEKSIIYRNLSKKKSDYILKMMGPEKNKLAIGTYLKIETNKSSRIFNNQPTRGFQSSSTLDIVFSLEKGETLKSATIIWSNLETQSIDLVKGVNVVQYGPTSLFELNITNNSISKSFPYKTKSSKYNDYQDQVLLPYEVSNSGPKAVFYQNARNEPAICIVDQSKKGISFFVKENLQWIDVSSNYKFDNFQFCSGIASGDLNNDGLTDLYITRGNYQDKKRANSQDYILLQQKDNSFETILSPVKHHSNNPQIADFNGDGLIDIFYAGGLKEGSYPSSYSSGFLLNKNGSYKNIEIGELAGIVTSSETHDLNQDEVKDIVFTGEWMSVVAYTFLNDEVKSLNDQFNNNLPGWYSSLESADIDGDNVPELILGNIGNNTKMSNLKEKAFHLYSHDFDKNGNLDIVFAFEDKDKLFPLRGKQCSSQQIPELKTKFEDYETFAKSDIFEIYGATNLQEGQTLHIKRYLSGYYKKDGSKYTWYEFPNLMQRSLMRASKLISGNLCPTMYYHGNQAFEVETGRLDGFDGAAYQICTDKDLTTETISGMCTQILELEDQLLYLFKDNPAIIIPK